MSRLLVLNFDRREAGKPQSVAAASKGLGSRNLPWGPAHSESSLPAVGPSAVGDLSAEAPWGGGVLGHPGGPLCAAI